MTTRNINFTVCPADAIMVDVMGSELDIPADEAARFIYQAGLNALTTDGVIMRELPGLRLKMAGESIARQREQTTPDSRYIYTGEPEALDILVPQHTAKELEMVHSSPEWI